MLLQVNLLLKEYLLSGDTVEAERCLRELEVPHFHHEFVYEVIVPNKTVAQMSKSEKNHFAHNFRYSSGCYHGVGV